MISLTNNIIEIIMQFRRMTAKQHCHLSCGLCSLPHVPKIMHFIQQQQPISFVLPAFPGKSPNLSKVIGSLPDMAERRSLKFLNNLCESIQKIYSPGAHIIICSDGRVFSDVVGMKDSDVSAYQQELDSIIHKLRLTHISTFNLEQFYTGKDFTNMRNKLLETFAEPIALLQEKIQRGAAENSSREDREANRMYCGITRFLFEDALYPGQTKSKTDIQKEARARAYGVIQRSNAWSNLIAKQFPDHVRLSIHPQTCGDVKLGIKLLAGNWMTPWHGVALYMDGEIKLVKRFEAEKLGAKLIYENGRPDHYQL